MAKRIQIRKLTGISLIIPMLILLWNAAIIPEEITEEKIWQEEIDERYRRRIPFTSNTDTLTIVKPANKDGDALFDRMYATRFIFKPKLGKGYDFVFLNSAKDTESELYDIPCPKAEGFSRIKKYTFDAKAFCRKGGTYKLVDTEIIETSDNPVSKMPEGQLQLKTTNLYLFFQEPHPCDFSEILFSVKVLEVFPGKDRRVCIAELLPGGR